MRSATALSVIRRHARGSGHTVRPLTGRGRGSHRIYALVDSSGAEVARFGLTTQRRYLSRRLFAEIEQALGPLIANE